MSRHPLPLRPTLLTLAVASFVATTAMAQEAPPPPDASSDEVAALEEIIVYSSTKTETKLTEIPQSISVITADQMQQYGAQGLDEAVRFSPGVVGGSYGFDPRTDWILVRGYDPARYLDGLTLPNGVYTQASRIEPYGLERIEVLKGPSSAMYGQQPPGGMLNMTSKRPSLDAQQEVVLTLGSFNQLQGAADVGGALTEDGSLIYRLVGLVRNSDTPVEMAYDKRSLFAPSVTWKPTESTELTVLARQQKTDSRGVSGFLPSQGTVSPNPNGKIPDSLYTGEPGYDGYDKRDESIGYEFSHRFGERLTFRQNLRFQSVDLVHPLVGANGFLDASGAFQQDEDGNQVPVGDGIPDDYRTLNRYTFNVAEYSRLFAIDNQFGSTLTTGALTHKLLAGVDYQRNRNDYMTGFGGAPSLDVFNPVYGAAITSPAYSYNQYNVLEQTGIYVQDQAQFGAWSFIGSLRHDSVTNDIDDRIFNTSRSQKDKEFSGRAGVNYLFENGVSPYIAYSHSFKSTVGTDFGGSAFKPTTGDQIEAGVKRQTRDTLLTAAVYTLTQQNALSVDPDHLFFSVQQGEVRTQGIELEARHHFTPSFSAGATYAYTDSEVTKDATSGSGSIKGNQLALVPKQQATLNADYDFVDGVLDGLGLGVAGRFVGKHYGDAANAFETSSYTLLDANAHYDLPVGDSGKSWRFQLTAANLLDREYISSCNSAAWCYYGYPRVVTGSISYRW